MDFVIARFARIGRNESFLVIFTHCVFCSFRCAVEMQSPIKDQLVSLLKRENRFDTLQNSRLEVSKQSCSPISTSFTSPNITSDISTRDVAAQWLHEVVNDSKSPLDVFLLAVTLMDKFLELQEVTKTQVQLCASACLLIASKLRIKDDHPLLSETQIVQYTDHSIDKTELKVIKAHLA